MNDDKMDEMIKRAAAIYNAPPADVPRDEMWAAIQAKRSAGPRVVYGSGARSSASPIRPRLWWGAAAAAVLLIAAGVGLGRWSATPASVKAPAVKTMAVTPPIVSPAVTDSPAVSAPTGVRVASTERVRTPGRPSAAQVNAGATVTGPNAAYQMATLTHLSNAEAMLTAFRSHADEKMDAAMSKWARDLLTNTRLLLDSPAADDPHRKQLLEDLELTLVDIVQLSPNAGAGDRKMIEKSLDQGRVLTKLRSAIPAGMQKGS
jgi:hypothetical protein